MHMTPCRRQVAERQHLLSASRRLYSSYTENTARHVRPSCVRRGWSDRLERTRQRSARSRFQLISWWIYCDRLCLQYLLSAV